MGNDPPSTESIGDIASLKQLCRRYPGELVEELTDEDNQRPQTIEVAEAMTVAAGDDEGVVVSDVSLMIDDEHTPSEQTLRNRMDAVVNSGLAEKYGSSGYEYVPSDRLLNLAEQERTDDSNSGLMTQVQTYVHDRDLHEAINSLRASSVTADLLSVLMVAVGGLVISLAGILLGFVAATLNLPQLNFVAATLFGLGGAIGLIGTVAIGLVLHYPSGRQLTVVELFETVSQRLHVN